MTLINVRKNAFFVGLTLINDHANLRYVICCSALISCNKVIQDKMPNTKCRVEVVKVSLDLTGKILILIKKD